MATILINGLKAKTGGGRSILSNYLSLLQGAQVNHRYLVLTPAREEYLRYESGNVSVIDVPGIFKANLFFPILYSLIFPQLIRRHGINLIFNLGDVVIPTRTRQVYLFDWAYAIYPESITWDRMGWRERMIRRIKVAFIRRWFGCATATIAQTDIARDRLKSLFGLDLVEVIPNAVSLENLGRGDAREFALPTGRRLLYLTYYYSHKNIEILIPVARLIREKGLDFKIVVTLDPRQGPGAAAFLEAISREGLDGIVVNVGLVEMRHVPSLYRQCQGLLMPTLLESFSGTYVEAMFHELAVFTSDLDFARAVCGECAWYFNPLDAGDILQTVVAGFSRDEEFKTRVRKGKLRVGAMPDWPQAFGKYQALLDRIAGSSG